MILRVGLTGGIASGKSTVGRLLERHGCKVIDADRIVAELYAPGAAGWTAIVEQYGRDILDQQGEIDRPRLAALAFRDAASADRLNSLIHPMVIAEEEGRLAAEREGIVVVEASLLLEAGGRSRYDRIIVVDIDEDLQLVRAVVRGMDAEEARRRRERQMPRNDRLRFADYIIENGGSLEDTAAQVARVYRSLVDDLQAKRDRSG